jgi:hypothetical protein
VDLALTQELEDNLHKVELRRALLEVAACDGLLPYYLAVKHG